MSNKLKKFLLNSFIVTMSSVIFRILAIFFNSYITTKIGKETLGLFNLVMSVYIFGITLATFGINFAVIRLISEEIAIGNNHGVKEITKKCIFISFICGLIASLRFFYIF